MSYESIIDAVNAVAGAWAVPGGVVVISDREGVVLEHAFGWADVERAVPATADHLFEIGSISKIMTSTAILQLVERGLLRLDDVPADLLDWLPPVLSGREITIERLLRHSAGLVSGVDAVQDEKAQLAGLDAGISPAPPGEFFHYSNLGYILLGQVATRVTGRPLADLVAEGILARIGAGGSTPTVTHRYHDWLATGYQPRDDDRPWLPGDPLAVAPFLEVDGADGAVATTGRALAAFARMLLNRGVGAHGEVVLSPGSFEAMTTRLAPGREDVLVLDGVPPTAEASYGLGVNVEHCDGRLVLTHGGGMVGFASFLIADVDAGFAVVVLTNANGDGPIAETVARTVAARHLSGDRSAPSSFSPSQWRGPSAAGPAGNRPRVLATGMLGDFAGSMGRLEIRSRPDGDGLVRVSAGMDGESSELQWTWGSRVLTRLPCLHPYPLEFDGVNWVCGQQVFRPIDAVPGDAVRPAGPPGFEAFCGHFRSYTPWFTNFRVVLRDGVLVLVASPGVEAPSDDVVLVPTGEGEFRIGEDPRLPERLRFGPVIDGLAQWADRDGCRYSRSFTP